MSPSQAQIAKNTDKRLFDARYSKLQFHDESQDGLFVSGNHIEQTFCRPGCPRTAPPPSHIKFYETAAAAHAAGLVPCRRCDPDNTPQPPLTARPELLANRAVTLINDGALDRMSVAELANVFAVTPRHLLRAVEAHTGVGPQKLARTNRAHLARILLTESNLTMGEVTLAAGFTSGRQFNQAIQDFYKTTPSRLRKRGMGSRHQAHVGKDGLVFTHALAYRKPLAFKELMAFLALRAIPGVEEGGADHYARTLKLPNGPGHVRIECGDDETLLATFRLTKPQDLGTAMARTRRMLDLDATPRIIDKALGLDEKLAPTVRRHPGLRLPGSPDLAETVIRAMVGQQISVEAAKTMLAKLCEALGGQTPWGRTFPTAAAIASRGHEILRGPQKRMQAIVGAAQAMASGQLRLHLGLAGEDLEHELLAQPGIGPWTVGYVLMRGLGNPDVLLVGDLGVRVGAKNLRLPNEAKALATYGAAWSPWRSYASIHLWANHG